MATHSPADDALELESGWRNGTVDVCVDDALALASEVRFLRERIAQLEAALRLARDQLDMRRPDEAYDAISAALRGDA